LLKSREQRESTGEEIEREIHCKRGERGGRERKRECNASICVNQRNSTMN